MNRLVLIFLFCLACVGYNNAALARPGHGSVLSIPPALCDATKIDNLCATSPGGTFQDVNLFTTVRQSGQAQYLNWSGVGSDSPVGANICGFDYACGNYTADASLTACNTSSCTGLDAGCSYVASPTSEPAPQVQCSPGCGNPSVPVVNTVSGHKFSDVSVSMNMGGGACSHAEIYNNVFIVGKNLCRGGSTEPVLTIAGSSWAYIASNKVEFDATCDPAANLWGSAAAAGAGLTQQSSFTGTLEASNGIVPAFLNIGTGTTGLMHSGQFVDWSGKTHSASTDVQITFFLGAPSSNNGFIGTGHIAGGPTLIIDSVDAASPSATPAGGDALFCASAGTSNCANRAGGWPIIRSSGGGWLLQGGIGTFSTPVAIVTAHSNQCSGSACDDGIFLAQQNLSTGPVAMTTGPINADIWFSSPGLGGNQCNTVGDGITFQWNALLEFDYMGTIKNDCPVHSNANYIWERSRNGDYLSGFSNPHTNSIIQQDESGSGGTTDSFGHAINIISEFRQCGDFVWYDKYSAAATLTGLFSNFAVGSQNKPGGFKTQFTQVQFCGGSTGIMNKTVNNAGDYTTPTNQTGIIYRSLGQSATAVANANVTTTDNGNGTGNLHVNTLNSGTIALGDGIQTSAAGAAQITATNGSDWTITPYLVLSAATVSFYPFTPQIDLFNMSGASVDPTGIQGNGCFGYDPNGVLIKSVTLSNNHNLTDNSAFSNASCNNHG